MAPQAAKKSVRACSSSNKSYWQTHLAATASGQDSQRLEVVGKVSTVVVTEKESREHQCSSGASNEEWQVHSWIQDMLEDSEVWQG